MSFVAGKHGMGQAQSQFSMGDCTECTVGSALYGMLAAIFSVTQLLILCNFCLLIEYPAGSPDPLTLTGGTLPGYTATGPAIGGATAGGDFGRPGQIQQFPGRPAQTGLTPAGGVSGFAPRKFAKRIIKQHFKMVNLQMDLNLANLVNKCLVLLTVVCQELAAHLAK